LRISQPLTEGDRIGLDRTLLGHWYASHRRAASLAAAFESSGVAGKGLDIVAAPNALIAQMHKKRAAVAGGSR
jgi:hypothetical protein